MVLTAQMRASFPPLDMTLRLPGAATSDK